MIRKKGKIIKWNDDKGFGFILPSDSQKNIFVHIKSFSDKSLRPTEGQDVTYTVQKNDDGRDSAIKVSRSTDNLVRNRASSNRKTNTNPTYKRINTKNTQLDPKPVAEYLTIIYNDYFRFCSFSFPLYYRRNITAIYYSYIYSNGNHDLLYILRRQGNGDK